MLVREGRPTEHILKIPMIGECGVTEDVLHEVSVTQSSGPTSVDLWMPP
jgi:hypothetical protein